jgi:hypothetical protein
MTEHKYHIEIGQRLKETLCGWAWTIALAWFTAAVVVVCLGGCVQPGAANVRVFDEQGVQVLVDGFGAKLDEWAPPPLEGDTDQMPKQLLVGAMGMYAVAEFRKWLRDRNGKGKP